MYTFLMNSPLVFIIPLYDTLSKYKKACLKIVKLYFFTGSINTNSVIIRKILTKLKSAGLITVARGTGGIEVIKPLKEITFYDVYVAIEPLENNELFNFHKNPNKECPVGKNIHKLLDRKLETIQKVMEDEMKKYTLEGLKDEMQEILGKKD